MSGIFVYEDARQVELHVVYKRVMVRRHPAVTIYKLEQELGAAIRVAPNRKMKETTAIWAYGNGHGALVRAREHGEHILLRFPHSKVYVVYGTYRGIKSERIYFTPRGKNRASQKARRSRKRR